MSRHKVIRTVIPGLVEAGFATPTQRSANEILLSIAHPGSDIEIYSFWHIVNLVWQPLIMYIEALVAGAGEQPEWTCELAVNDEALQLEMQGTVLDADKHLSVDDWHRFIQTTIVGLVNIEVPERLISKVVAGTAC